MPVDLHIISLALIGYGALNWMAGSHSFFGVPMEMRREPFWVACRWLALGHFLSSSDVFESLISETPELGLIASIVFFIGCLRRRTETPDIKALVASHRNIQTDQITETK